MESIDNTGITARRVILILLREDLRSEKLLQGLDALGFDADRYTLDVDGLVFELMGFEEPHDHVMEMYRNLIDQGVKKVVDVEHRQVLEELADDIYVHLLIEKERQVKQRKGAQ